MKNKTSYFQGNIFSERHFRSVILYRKPVDLSNCFQKFVNAKNIKDLLEVPKYSVNCALKNKVIS